MKTILVLFFYILFSVNQVSAEDIRECQAIFNVDILLIGIVFIFLILKFKNTIRKRLYLDKQTVISILIFIFIILFITSISWIPKSACEYGGNGPYIDFFGVDEWYEKLDYIGNIF